MATFTLTEGDDVFQVPDDAGHTVSALGGNDTISGAAGNDSLYGEAGNDSLEGGEGNDWLFGGDDDDTLVAGAGADLLDGGAGNDAFLVSGDAQVEIDGRDGIDTLFGSAGNDTLRGGRDIEVVDGGDGTDVYVGAREGVTFLGVEAIGIEKDVNGDAYLAGRIDELTGPIPFVALGTAGGTLSFELAGVGGTLSTATQFPAGFDSASVDASYLESAIWLGGTTGNDTLFGTNFDDTLVGGDGVDDIYSGYGDDLVFGGDGNDIIRFDANNGEHDTLSGGAGDDTFIWQYGDTSATTIRGDAGWDVLYAPMQLNSMNVRGVEELRTDGTTVFVGVDQLRGFKSLTVENTSDWLSFIVVGSGGSVNLGPRVGEVGGVSVLADGATSAVALTGTDLTDAFVGTGFDDLLIGGGGDDALVGDAQRSSGGPAPTISNDTLFGGHGNDELWGEGGDDKLYGGTGSDTLWGGAGNDDLNGGVGVDSMTGGDGDDTYIVDDTQDVTTEAPGAGVDTVRASVAWTLGADIEHLVLTGWRSTAGTGNAADNAITGNGGRNTLAGKEGNDTINGGRGSDNLWGGSGQDTFVFDTALGTNNVDRIRDFEFTGDIIALDSRIFTELTPGAIDFPVFNFGGAETLTAEQRISYDQFRGGLYYDADGAGGAAAVQFAQLQAGLALSPENFVVI